MVACCLVSEVAHLTETETGTRSVHGCCQGLHQSASSSISSSSRWQHHAWSVLAADCPPPCTFLVLAMQVGTCLPAQAGEAKPLSNVRVAFFELSCFRNKSSFLFFSLRPFRYSFYATRSKKSTPNKNVFEMCLFRQNSTLIKNQKLPAKLAWWWVHPHPAGRLDCL